jgi:hypothetical protein
MSIVRTRSLHHRCIAVFLSLLLTAQPVMANWLAWASAGASVTGALTAAAATAWLPPASAASFVTVGGCLGILQILGWVATVAVELTSEADSSWENSLAGFGQPGTAMPGMAMPGSTEPGGFDDLAFLDAEFQHLELSGDEAVDPFVSATNNAIDATNAMLTDLRVGCSLDAFAENMMVLASAFEDAADVFDALDFPEMAFTQMDFDEAIDDFFWNGLPDVEVDFLIAAGMSEDFIGRLGVYAGSMQIELAGSVTISQILHEMARQAAPQPPPQPPPPPPPQPPPPQPQPQPQPQPKPPGGM